MQAILNPHNQQSQPRFFLPFYFRFVLVCIVVLFFLQWYQVPIDKYVCCNFENLKSQYSIWSFFTGWICEKSQLIYMIVGLQFLSIIHKFETKNGSSVAINDLIVNYAGISFFVLAFEAFYYFVRIWVSAYIIKMNAEEMQVVKAVPQWFVAPGLVLITFNILYKYCYFNQDKHVRYPWPFMVVVGKLNYYYIFIYLITIVIEAFPYLIKGSLSTLELQGIINILRLDALLGIILAMAECRYLKGGMILYAVDSYTDKQYYCSFLYATHLECWVPTNPKSIEPNQRLTVSSKQFFEDLGQWGYNKLWNQPGAHDSELQTITSSQQYLESQQNPIIEQQ